MSLGRNRQSPGVRTGFDTLDLYPEAAGYCAADLSDNTNLWGTPPAASAAIQRFGAVGARGYPPAYTPALKESLAAYTEVDPSMIVTGCGSDDVLDAAIRAYGNPGSRLACCNPTFSMIPVFARVNGLIPAFATFDDDWNIPVEQLLSLDAEIIYICSPNNPTATSASIDRIEAVADEFNGLVIVDEAYAEYSATSLTPTALRHDNVLVTRTMSKVFGMAGLRLGYGIGEAALVREVEKSRGPYKVSAIAEATAIAALAEDVPWINDVVAETLSIRSRFVSTLTSLGYSSLPSDANFVLVPMANATVIAQRLLGQGVAVRSFANLPQIGDALRITIGPWDLMQRFLDAIETCQP